MKTMEIFCGTKSFSKVAARRGHETYTVDSDSSHKADETVDIRMFNPKKKADILWASPPCQGFSVAVIGRNWHRGGIPKTNRAKEAIELVREALRVIEEVKPTWFFVENPRGMLRKLDLLSHLRRVTVSYCQYGDERMKPTDIWTNVPEEIWNPLPMCKPKSTCHISAPRGARTGTQGLKGAVERGRIPEKLFDEIFDSLEKI